MAGATTKITFDSPSTAVAVLPGRTGNGRTARNDATRKTLKIGSLATALQEAAVAG